MTRFVRWPNRRFGGSLVQTCPQKMEDLMKLFWKMFDHVLEWILMGCTFSMAVLCFIQVVFRYVFNSSIPWSEEACRYLFSVVVFFGGIICVRDKGHVCVDILIQQLPYKVKRYYSLLLYALMLVFSLFLAKAGWELAIKNMYQVSSALRISLGWVYMTIPFSGLFMGINSIRRAIWEFRENSQEEKVDE